jgi:hypothetical protein
MWSKLGWASLEGKILVGIKSTSHTFIDVLASRKIGTRGEGSLISSCSDESDQRGSQRFSDETCIYQCRK